MRTLADLEVLIVDCQATGASPAFGHVLELGWGVLRAGTAELTGAESHWIRLPEGYSVPKQVRKITGYEPDFAADAISDSEAWERLRMAVGRAESMPTAIHYARFELSFLRNWAARFEPQTSFPFDAVCLHAVARRLYPELPRQSLRALAGFLGHGLHLERRSLGHVEATAFIWRRLVADLRTRGIERWEALHGWLAERPSAPARSKKARYPIERQRYLKLPDAPGVYHLLRKNGDVLYVGKATSLKKRVASHFTGRPSKALAPEMLTQVSDIAVTQVSSALEAALLENETIKRLKPPYNVQLMDADQPVWYGTREFDAASVTPDDRYYVGPVPSEHSLAPLGALIALARGMPPSERLRWQLVGVSALRIPDEDVFQAGWSDLVARHPDELGESSGAPRRRALALARKLLLAPGLKPRAEAADSEPAVDRGWDPARIARHVEHAVAQAYRAYRRARWLLVLGDSDVLYSEPGVGEPCRLTLRAGQIVFSMHGSLPRACVAAEHSRTLSQRFDRIHYDRLRILTTELKRVARDGGEVTVRSGGRHELSKRFLVGALKLL